MPCVRHEDEDLNYLWEDWRNLFDWQNFGNLAFIWGSRVSRALNSDSVKAHFSPYGDGEGTGRDEDCPFGS